MKDYHNEVINPMAKWRKAMYAVGFCILILGTGVGIAYLATCAVAHLMAQDHVNTGLWGPLSALSCGLIFHRMMNWLSSSLSGSQSTESQTNIKTQHSRYCSAVVFE